MQGKKPVGKEPEGKEIAPAEQTSSIEAIMRKDPVLTILLDVGCSTEVFEKLRRLKDVFTEFKFRTSPIEFVELSFYPDPKYPTNIDRHIGYRKDLKVTFGGIPSKGIAVLSIGEEAPQGPLAEHINQAIAIVTLNDLQEFVRALAPGKSIRLGWRPKQNPEEPEKGINAGKVVLVDLLTLTQEEYNALPPLNYELIIEGQKTPTLMVGQFKPTRGKDMACQLSKFRFAGPGQDVENAIVLLTRLFDYENGVNVSNTSETKQLTG